jgi:molybdate/tungstate transport system substrate-binding protein
VWLATLVSVSLSFLGDSALATDELSGDLVILHAGSLSVPFKRVADAFASLHPNVVVKAEAAGTRDCARKISDLGRSCDVFGAADFRVVVGLLMPEHADFNIRFARNEMVIAHTGHSLRSEDINSNNWHELLLDPDIYFGRADPQRDPCGYRTEMVFQLAERHYGVPNLARELSAKHGTRFIRPKETDLLALMEAGEIDYLFIYRSVAAQHGLSFVELPDEVDLGSVELDHIYATSVVELTGKKPGEIIMRKGASIVYSVTVPKDARNRQVAEAFVAFLLSPDGRTIMEESGQPTIAPSMVRSVDNVPESLRGYCRTDDTE